MSDSKKYNAVLRTYTVRNVYEDVLTPGTDVIIPAGNILLDFRTVVNLSADINAQTNFMVRRTGVFSNFADGLVFKEPSERIDVDMRFIAYRRVGSLFNMNVTYGSRAVTTTGGDGWIAGNRFAITLSNGAVMYVFATGAGAGNFEDYWPFQDIALVSAQNIVPVGTGINYVFQHISTLNCMYEVNEFAQPFLYSSNNDFDIVALHCGLNISQPHTTTLMTDIINIAFTDKAVFFDIVNEVEFTK